MKSNKLYVVSRLWGSDRIHLRIYECKKALTGICYSIPEYDNFTSPVPTEIPAKEIRHFSHTKEITEEEAALIMITGKYDGKHFR